MRIIEKNEMKYASGGGATTCESAVHDIGSTVGSLVGGVVTSETGPGATIGAAVGGLLGGFIGDGLSDSICGSHSEHNDHEGKSDKGDCEGGSCHP